MPYAPHANAHLRTRLALQSALVPALLGTPRFQPGPFRRSLPPPRSPTSSGCVAHLASAAPKGNLRTPWLRARGSDALSPGRPQASGAPDPEPARRGRCAAQSLSPAWPALLLIGRHLGGRATRLAHLPSPLHGQIGGCGTPAPRDSSTRGQAWGSADLLVSGLVLSPPRPQLRPRETLPREVLCPPGHTVTVHLTPPGAPHSARDCHAAPHGASAAPGRQDALRRPLGQPGFVGEPNFALHFHLRLRLGDLAAAAPV